MNSRNRTPRQTGDDWPFDSSVWQWRHLAVLSAVGEGEFSQVFRAWNCQANREVVLKLIDIRSAPARLLVSQANRMRRIRHSNVVSIYGAETWDGLTGIWMELVEGHTLERIVEQRGPMGPQEAAVTGIGVCRGLAAIHAAGLLHGSLSARNVMREQGGRVVLMDPGVVSAGSSDRGRPGIGALRQLLTGKRLGRELDIYSAGALLYFLVTGRQPMERNGSGLRGETPHRFQLLSDLRPDLPASFVHVVEKALCAEGNKRFRSAGEMERALGQLVHQGTNLPSSRKISLRGVLLACLVLLLALALGLLSQNLDFSPAPIGGPVAVLPLLPAASDPDTEYLGDGISESLINRLSRVSGLGVIPRSTVFRWKGTRIAVPEVGKQLGAAAVLTGRIVPRGDDITIQVELVEVSQGKQIWSEHYERSLMHIQGIEVEIVKAVLQSLGVGLEHQDARKVTVRHTQNAEAYRLFLKGRHLWNKSTEDSAKIGLQCLKQAVELDPAYALAYSSLANCYLLLSHVGGMEPNAACPIAKDYAQKALELDGQLADAHASMGAYYLYYEWNFSAAERELTRALQLDPRSPDARGIYATYLSAVGRPEESKLEREAALDLDPLSPLLQMNLGGTYYFARQYDDAVAEVRSALELEPNLAFGFFILGCAYGQQGRYEEALVELEKARRIPGGFVLSTCEMAYVLGKSGRVTEARKLLREIEALRSKHWVDPYFIATAYLGLGEIREVLTWLERGYQEHSFMMPGLIVDPKFDPIRSNRRFQNLRARLQLP